MEQATTRQIQNQNQRQPQSNRQAGQQVQAKALNQVTTEIDTRMGNMFTELNTKYDTVSNHIKRIDVQLAQTAESVKRQQGARCMNSRHTRRNAQGELVTFSNQELARLERTNRQQSGPNNAIMGDFGNKEQLTAQMQQQMQQLQDTIQAQEQAAQQAAEQAALQEGKLL
ncbi:hypothetical protein DY000_02048935 [Brassica cretica]|uniref:Syntaxin N-terminal domain-containing protein n=1 Tax=Brassica cretica TaxID=69181 RepID=A0ABQ7ERC1_BRACR|nr:hypothetical protein DY000_02048935 [Brassica cretica]